MGMAIHEPRLEIPARGLATNSLFRDPEAETGFRFQTPVLPPSAIMPNLTKYPGQYGLHGYGHELDEFYGMDHHRRSYEIAMRHLGRQQMYQSFNYGSQAYFREDFAAALSLEPQSNGHFLTGADSDAEGLASPPKLIMSKSMMELDELLSKLNPMAREFVPPDHDKDGSCDNDSPRDGSTPNSAKKSQKGASSGKLSPKSGTERCSRVHREDSIKRTVYVADIDQQVTEEQLAGLFLTCGQIVDCRVCGDPNSVLRFAFVEFLNEEGAKRSLELAGKVLGYYPLRVLPSKTAIVPVNPTFLPRSVDERELCARTIYCANIDRKVTQSDVKLFFESLCGEVSRLRLLGDYNHSTRIAFVEFTVAESAVAALNCSGAILGSMPIRVSPSKTPVRARSPRITGSN